MLSFKATDVGGAIHSLPAPLSVLIRMEEDVPADDLYAVFPDTDFGELCGITVFDGDSVVFTGVIDEEEHIVRRAGRYLRISARSLAAHLIDNEAPPRGYDHPSARMIYDRHVRDYGISAGDADDATCFGELSITKGMSQWGVVKAFCRACYSSVPRVSSDGVLYMKGMPSKGMVVFGSGGLRCTEICDSRRRCEELSRVNVKISAGDGYSYPVENSDAVGRGIRRERYLNAMLTTSAVKSADVMLSNSCQDARIITLKCPQRLLGILGCDAEVRDSSIKESEHFYVSSIRYRMDSGGEQTAVKLKRRITECG